MKILNKDLSNYQALLFDLDGTIVDSMPTHNKAWKETFKENGVEITNQFLIDTMGMASQRIVSIVNEQFGVKLDPKSISRQKRDKYKERVSEVQTVPAVMEIIKKYHKSKPMAVITASSREVVSQLLPSLGIDHFFDAIVCADDTEKGKDSPEPYLLATEKLKVNIEKCLFLDDGDVGLKGAQLCKIDTIHVDISTPEIFIK
jgi:HAD superfamily hydrolase (TIGR01509 family)